MKYFITASFEMDGHSAAMCMICNSAEAKKQYLDALLYEYGFIFTVLPSNIVVLFKKSSMNTT